MRARILILGLLLVGADLAVAEPARFAVRGELQASANSHDGRFSLRAQAQVTPEATSGDGRFALKSTNASCDPLDPSVFRNGFENP